MRRPYSSYAAVIKAVILADNTITDTERKKFDEFFAEHFGLPLEKRQALWLGTTHDTSPLQDHIDAIRVDLEDKPAEIIAFFKFLNNCIYSDGIAEGEYETFEQIETMLLGTA